MARRDSQSHAGRAQAAARRLRETARGNVRGRAEEAQVGGGEGLRMADAARVWAKPFAVASGKRRSARERACEWADTANARAKPFSVARGSVGRRGRGACEWRTRQEGGQSVRGRVREAKVGGRGACEWRTRQEGGQAVFGCAEKAQVGGREGPANGGRGKGTDEPFAVASGKRNGHWDRWEDWVGECGQGHAGRSGQALAGKRALRGRGGG